VPQGDWRKALEEEWAHVSAPAALRADEEWRCFNLAALRSKAKLKQPPSCGGGCRPKGSLPEVLKVGSQIKFKQGEGTFRQRSLAKYCHSRQVMPPKTEGVFSRFLSSGGVLPFTQRLWFDLVG